MKTKKLGKHGPEVTAICLGAWPLGGGMGALPDKQVIETVHAALDSGVNFIDTAEGYRTSESVLGKALKGKREKVILATKLSGDHTPEHMSSAIENSLRSLQTDYIDLYQLHQPRPETPIEQTMEGLSRLKEHGKIRFIGVSNFSAEEHAEALRYGHIDSSQPMYSMFVRTAGEKVLPFCREHGIGVINHSPLAKGLLTGRYTKDHVFPKDDERSWMAAFQGERFSSALAVADKLKAWAEKRGHTLAGLAIAWVLSNPAVTSCIVGAKTPAQAVKNAAAAEWMLSPAEIQQIEEIQGTFRIQNLHH